jgi:hypothetical protein
MSAQVMCLAETMPDVRTVSTQGVSVGMSFRKSPHDGRIVHVLVSYDEFTSSPGILAVVLAIAPRHAHE